MAAIDANENPSGPTNLPPPTTTAEKGDRLVATLLEEDLPETERGAADTNVANLLDTVLGDPDSTSYELTFDEVDDRISEFQEDTLVKQAFAKVGKRELKLNLTTTQLHTVCWKGVDLREYAKQIESELDEIEHLHVLDYVKQSRSLVDLHSQIQTCDQILENMEKLLSGFQADLGNISAEIETLQEQSQTMNIKLKNRTAMQQMLNSVFNGIVLSPDLIRKISEGEVNEFFLQHLADLNAKMTYVKNQQGRHIHSLKDVGPELERLRLKAAEKSRDFLLKKIESLKAPNTNIAIIQQNILLKYKELYSFLLERYMEAAAEIRQNYVNTVSNYYLASFDKYIKSLLKLQMVIADKLDLIGYEESAKRGLFTGKLVLKDKTNVFTLGDRLQVLTNPDPGIILTHVAEDQNMKFAYEAIFKSMNRLMMDNACSEYIFTLDFFAAPKSRQNRMFAGETASAIFVEIFDPTLKLLTATFKQHVDNSFDAVGILLCIRLNSQNIRIMQKRRIPCLENFTNAINMLLWPRFQAIMDMHIESLKKAVASKLISSKDVHPHYVTRRYAELAASILTLNQGYDDALLNNSLLRVRSEVESLLIRMSGEFADKKSRLVFLINNFDLVATILSEHAAASFDQEKAYFNATLDNKTAEYVEEELRPHFLELMAFVTRSEADPGVLSYDPDKFEKVATSFNNSWKAALTSINGSVMQSFPNFQNGARILHGAFTQMLLYYKRFLTLWEKRFGNKKQRVQPIGMQSVMVEIKKFR
ncbi:Vacuolar protein sorting-associated protein 52 [Borealophlyctis nickersoniae]|nr:Vacuolar protein sorting-associated protein 52 [Borealophlyctis nickersoniae]